MTISTLLDRLVSEFNYPPAGARLVATKLERISPPVRAAFLTWWNSGSAPPLEIHSYSVERLVDEHGMNPVAAYLTLDWLRRSPEEALKSLQKGHDRVG